MGVDGQWARTFSRFVPVRQYANDITIASQSEGKCEVHALRLVHAGRLGAGIDVNPSTNASPHRARSQWPPQLSF
jgi:hypothetical protein